MNLRNLVIWGVIVVVLIGLYSMMTGGGRAAGASEITYSQLLSKVSSGEVVKHEFVFTNIGTATLEIKDVRPGCGCTTAGTWDKLVEPGKTGKIPLQFNSANFGGAVLKQATVTCNDPGQSNVTLQIKGTVWKAIDVTPTMAVFTAPASIRVPNAVTTRMQPATKINVG